MNLSMLSMLFHSVVAFLETTNTWPGKPWEAGVEIEDLSLTLYIIPPIFNDENVFDILQHLTLNIYW